MALRASAIEYGLTTTTSAPPPPPPKRVGVFRRLFARRAGSAMSGLGMASSESYALAKQLVDMLAINDFVSASALVYGNDPQDIAEIGRKAIALGADPQRVAQFVAYAGSTEIVEIVDTKPVVGSVGRPWWHYALGLLAAGGAGYGAWRKWGRR